MESYERAILFFKGLAKQPSSPSTGNVCCFDGMTTYDDDKEFRNIFLSVSDCHVSARLHKTDNDSVEDFIKKLESLNDEISKFLAHLKSFENNGQQESAAV